VNVQFSEEGQDWRWPGREGKDEIDTEMKEEEIVPQRLPPAKGAALQCAMEEEAAEGGIEWVPGKVTSVNMKMSCLTVSVTVGSKTWDETYQLSEEGEEWRWPLAGASTPGSNGEDKEMKEEDIELSKSDVGILVEIDCEEVAACVLCLCSFESHIYMYAVDLSMCLYICVWMYLCASNWMSFAL